MFPFMFFPETNIGKKQDMVILCAKSCSNVNLEWPLYKTNVPSRQFFYMSFSCKEIVAVTNEFN